MKFPLSGRAVACVGAIASLVALVLIPYVTNALWFDDSLNSQISGLIHRAHSNLWDFSYGMTKAWLIGQGRFVLGLPLGYTFFYFIHDTRVVRIVDVAFLILNVSLVVVLLRRSGLTWLTIGLFLVFLFIDFQIRGNDDPIASYAIFCQTLGIAITLSLILIQGWWRSGNVWMLAGSSVIAGLSLYFYELNIIYAPIALGVVIAAPHAHRFRSLLIISTPILIFCLATLYFRLSTNVSYPGTKLGTLGAAPVAYAKQFIGAFPGSYYAFGGHVQLPLAQLLRAVAVSPIAWAIAILTGGLLFGLAYRMKHAQTRVSWGVVAVAAAFVALPPVLMAISSKYQTLGWGQAYLPVYYSYFGVALLAALGFTRLAQVRSIWLVGMLALVVALYASANWSMNMWQAALGNRGWGEPVYTLTKALKRGLLQPVRDADVVEIVDQPIFINGNLIYQLAHKDISVPEEVAGQAPYGTKPRPDAKHYKLYRDPAFGHPWRLAAID